jgi:hypothetical protein
MIHALLCCCMLQPSLRTPISRAARQSRSWPWAHLWLRASRVPAATSPTLWLAAQRGGAQGACMAATRALLHWRTLQSASKHCALGLVTSASGLHLHCRVVTFDAADSMDPDDPIDVTPMVYTWECYAEDLSPCYLDGYLPDQVCGAGQPLQSGPHCNSCRVQLHADKHR